jgi:1-acyl-sn-glycerol-3-phosphate acyltransferase
MGRLWIQFLINYLRLGFFFYYKKIKVVGRENIPKKGAILFVCNHQNALIDPLLIGTTNHRSTHFLTRAGVFKKKLVIKLFNSVQMIPIYRIRDGYETLSKNDAIFDKCIHLLNKKEALVIFPEGSHNLKRKVRPLSKGFTRILFGAFENHPELEIKVVPVGLNYNSIAEYPASVSIHYGKPFSVKELWNKDDLTTSITAIKEVVRNEIKLLTTHIDDPSNYEKIYEQLIHSKADFLDPISTNKQIKNIELKDITSTQKKHKKSIVYYIVVLNSIIPWLLLKKVKTKIKEREFTSTFRYGLGITLFPTFYILQSLILYSLFCFSFAVSYFSFCILTGLILTKTSRNPQD